MNPPYTGLWINIPRYFGPRWSEWLMAAAMAGWGVVMLLPYDTFGLPSYAGFRAIFGSEVGIGTVLVMAGFIRLLALWVNGHRRQVTYWTRNVAAGLGFLIWIGMFFAHVLSGVIGAWLVFYPAFVVIEIINGARAGHDIGASRGLGS